jgi:ATP phosphoribosyltransferase
MRQMSIRIAIGKGRGNSKCLRFFERGRIKIPQEFHSGRLTILESYIPSVVLVQARGIDLPWMLEKGYVDCAIGSSIWFIEHEAFNFVKGADLDIRSCRLSLIIPQNWVNKPLNRVCTRFPKTTMRKSHLLDNNTKIIHMAGCNEVALSLGFADAIVDIVETGWSLRNMYLAELEVLCLVQHGIWLKENRPGLLKSLHTLMPGVNWDKRNTEFAKSVVN